MKDTNFRRQLLTRVALSIAIIAAIVAGILFMGRDIKVKGDYIFSTRAGLHSRLNSISQLSQLKVLSDEAEPYLAKLTQALPQRDALLSVRTSTENIARRYDLGYSFNFTGDESDISSGLKAIKFHMSAQGSYQNIINFINAIESIPYFITMTNIDIA